MESTVTWSPPTSRAIAARSSVAVMTLSFPAAWAGTMADSAARIATMRLAFIWNTSERVRSVRTHGELELEEYFVGGEAIAVARSAKLAADLGELARPISHDDRASSILDERCEWPVAAAEGIGDGGLAGAALGTVETAAKEPAPGELIIAGSIVAEGPDRAG